MQESILTVSPELERLSKQVTPEQQAEAALTLLDNVLFDLGEESTWSLDEYKEVMNLIMQVGPLMVSENIKKGLRHEWHELKRKIDERESKKPN